LITVLIKKLKLPYLIPKYFGIFINTPIITNLIVKNFSQPNPNNPIAKSWSALLAQKVTVEEIYLDRYLLSVKWISLDR